MKKILGDIRVVELSTLLPGPFCSMMLMEQGAKVIKVEDTLGGDQMRSLPPFNKFQNSYFLLVNRGKESIQLNLKSKEGISIFEKMVREADVLIESYRPGKTESMGISYHRLKRINPGLIHCSITGFGHEGPYSSKPGHDINFLSLSGFLELNAGERPILPPTMVGDLAGAIMACNKILLAIIRRERDGRGEFIDASLTDSAFVLMSPIIMEYLSGVSRGEVFQQKRYLTGSLPCYNIYETKDHRYISLGAIEKSAWADFCHHFSLRLEDKQFSNEKSVENSLRELFMSRTFKEWARISQETDFCLTPVNSAEDLPSSDYLKSKDAWKSYPHPTEGVVKYIAFSGNDDVPAPLLGEHTVSIMRSLGYLPEDIARLKGNGIINYPSTKL